MRSTLVSPASGLTLVTLATSAFARVAYPGAKRQTVEVCTNDDVLIGLFGNNDSNYEHDATTFCEGLLGLTATTSCIAYTTSMIDVYPTTITINETVTSTFTSPTSTVTVTATDVVFGLGKRELAARAAITARAEYLKPAINAFEQKAKLKRQASSSNLDAALSSACLCEHIDPGTDLITCTAPNATVTVGVTAYEFITANVTIPGGVATVTSTVNSTVLISTSSTVSTTTGTPLSTTPLSTTPTYNTSSTWGSWNWTTSQTTPSSTSGTPNITSSTTIPISPINGTASTTSTTSMPTVTPSGCPSLNGTSFPSLTNPCLEYLFECGITFPDNAFYTGEENYATPQQCAAVCDAENTGVSTPCLGIVWDPTATANCRQIRDTSNPIHDNSSVALLLVANPACNNSTSSSTTTAGPISISTMPMICINGTGAGCITSTTTTTGIPYGNTTTTTTPIFTTTSNSTISPFNTTTATSYIPSSTGTPPINGTTTSSNSSCAATTEFSTTTVYGMMTNTITETAFVSNISTVLVTISDVATITLAGNTVTVTDIADIGGTVTVTITASNTVSIGSEGRFGNSGWFY